MTSISEERAKLASVGWRLRRREEWGSQYNYTNARAVTTPATRVFVHITITNPASYPSDDAHARAVERIGISRFPATGISYNRLIFQSGQAMEGQPIGRRGAHTVNDEERATCNTAGCPGRGGPLTAPSWNLNSNSRAYVICQNVRDRVTAVQLDSLAKCIAADILAEFVVPKVEIHGHRCVSAKSCPADPMWARMAELRTRVDHYLEHGLQPAPEPEPRKDSTMGFLIKGGTRHRLVTGDRIVGVSQADYDLLAKAGMVNTGVSNELVNRLDVALVAEIDPALDEEAPPA